jgi:hypothetical protein
LGGDISFDFGPAGFGRLRQACRPGDPGGRRALSGAWNRGQGLRGRRSPAHRDHQFDSVEKAAAAHDSAGYQEALKVLGKGADRDMRIVEGVD